MKITIIKKTQTNKQNCPEIKSCHESGRRQHIPTIPFDGKIWPTTMTTTTTTIYNSNNNWFLLSTIKHVTSVIKTLVISPKIGEERKSSMYRGARGAFALIMTSFQNINFFIALSLSKQWQWNKSKNKTKKNSVCSMLYAVQRGAVDDDTGYHE
jgi:hypothetical protein